jgi:hypothetical protein
LPLKILGVVALFLICKPLGLALLAFLIWRSFRSGRGLCRPGFRAMERGPSVQAGDRPAMRNTAFEERRQGRLKELEEEANAFEDFERRQREAVDKEAFDRFMADRRARRSPDEPRS